MGNDLFAFIGTYTRLGSEGIYTLRMNGDTGELTRVSVTTGLENPSFVALDPTNEHLYAVSEVSNFDGSGGVTAFAVNADTGELTQINQQSTGGPGPCHLMVDATDSMVIVTNYGGGSIAALPINSDGSVGELTEFIQHEGSSVNQRRQTHAHAHSVNIDKTNQRAYVCDLGMDKVLTYDIDLKNGKLTPSSPASVDEVAGEGPRHFTFHPSDKFVYVNNELGNTVTVYDLASDGALTPKQTESTIPDSWEGVTHTADIHVSPDGKFLYCSNRGHDSLAIFSIDQSNGEIARIGNESTRGKTPRNFAITPDGRFLLAENQDSGNIVTFKRESDGTLTPTGSEIDIPAPVCLQFMPVGG
ncbi:MAG: lactonase family protein [Chloroflexi bacterium]|nr:lactonase family protein [Chloroflexota bacterium]